MTNLVFRDTNEASAIERTEQQFKESPNYLAFLKALTQELDELEASSQELLLERSLDLAVGVNLDNIGGILNIPREARGDEEYRVLLKVFATSRSASGTPTDVMIAAQVITNSTNVNYWEHYPAYVTLEVASDTVGKGYVDVIKKSVPAAVGLSLYSSQDTIKWRGVDTALQTYDWATDSGDHIVTEGGDNIIFKAGGLPIGDNLQSQLPDLRPIELLEYGTGEDAGVDVEGEKFNVGLNSKVVVDNRGIFTEVYTYGNS